MHRNSYQYAHEDACRNSRRAFFAGRSLSKQPGCATWFELCFYPATMTFLLVLSSLWMVPLTKGLIKALKKATKKD